MPICSIRPGAIGGRLACERVDRLRVGRVLLDGSEMRGALLNIAGPSVVKVIDELERMELLRRDSSTDRRVYALRLTDKGLAALRRYHAAVAKFEAKIASELTKTERRQLFALLAKVAPEED